MKVVKIFMVFSRAIQFFPSIVSPSVCHWPNPNPNPNINLELKQTDLWLNSELSWTYYSELSWLCRHILTCCDPSLLAMTVTTSWHRRTRQGGTTSPPNFTKPCYSGKCYDKSWKFVQIYHNICWIQVISYSIQFGQTSNYPPPPGKPRTLM